MLSPQSLHLFKKSRDRSIEPHPLLRIPGYGMWSGPLRLGNPAHERAQVSRLAEHEHGHAHERLGETITPSTHMRHLRIRATHTAIIARKRQTQRPRSHHESTMSPAIERPLDDRSPLLTVADEPDGRRHPGGAGTKRRSGGPTAQQSRTPANRLGFCCSVLAALRSEVEHQARLPFDTFGNAPRALTARPGPPGSPWLAGPPR